MKRFHLALDVSDGGGFSVVRDVNGILWERVTADQQAAEIRQTWLSTSDLQTKPI